MTIKKAGKSFKIQKLKKIHKKNLTTTFKVVIGTQSFYLLNEVIGKQENYYSEVYSKSDKYDVVNRFWLPVFKHGRIIEP